MNAPSSSPGQASRRTAIGLVVVIVLLIGFYLVTDRVTPYTSQARVQAFVIPVAATIALIGLYWTLQRVGVLAG